MKRIVVYFIFMVLIVSCTRTTKRMRQAKQDSGPEVIINPNPDPFPLYFLTLVKKIFLLGYVSLKYCFTKSPLKPKGMTNSVL